MPENKTKNTVLKVCLALFIAVITVVLLNSSGLYDWANRMEIGKTRTTFLEIIKPLHKISKKYGFDIPKEKTQEYFRDLAGINTKAGFNSGSQKFTTTNVDSVSPPQTDTLAVTKSSENLTSAEFDPFVKLKTRIYNKNHPLKLLLIGDSMMGGGLGTILSRTAKRDTLLDARRVYELSSGLTRNDFFDWFIQADLLLNTNNYDVVIVVIGTNDAQASEINGRKCPFGSEQWLADYETKVREFMNIINHNAEVVYWLGLPPMRDEGFDSRIKKLNSVYRDVTAESQNVLYFPLDTLIGDYALKFTSFLNIDDKLVKIRLDDGIHLTNEGGSVIAGKLLNQIKKDISLQ